MIDDIVHSLEIRAPIERVWMVMTEPALVGQWLGCLNFAPQVGHVFHMQSDPVRRAAGDIEGATHCEILRLDRPRELLFSWYLPDTPRTNVSIRLTAIDGGTRIDFRHDGWDQFDEAQIRTIRDALAGGWTSFVLPQLKRVAEEDATWRSAPS
jgi:uncharacterized protein YndB with AHSA1/START domain